MLANGIQKNIKISRLFHIQEPKNICTIVAKVDLRLFIMYRKILN